MDRDLNTLTERDFDLIIIGGGAFGAAAAWDASLRGMSVALIERADFGSGASGQCFKIVHGGIRYLQHADLRRLRSSCRERSALLRIAPHQVAPLPILIPTYGHGKRSKFLLTSASLLYDLLTFDRNQAISDSGRKMPVTRALSRSEVLSEYESLERSGLTGGVVFHDGQMYNPPRLVLAFVQSAYRAGAAVANYVEATKFNIVADRVVSVTVHDRESGDVFDIRGRFFLNAAGPWAENLLSKQVQTRIEETGTFSRDSCFVVRKRFDSRYGLAVSGQTYDADAVLSRGARHLFLVPWRDYTLVGVWHKVWQDSRDLVTITENELEGHIREVNSAYPGLELRTSDILTSNYGLVPFGDSDSSNRHMSYGKESRVIDHEALQGLKGLFTLIGIRYTMARGDAERVLDQIAARLGKPVNPCRTAVARTTGGDIDDFSSFLSEVRSSVPAGIPPGSYDSLARNYGTQFRHVLALGKDRPELLQPIKATKTLKAEIVHAVDAEMALHLDDALLRRTDIATGERARQETLDECAALMANLLGWSSTQRRSEVERISDTQGSNGPIEPQVRN